MTSSFGNPATSSPRVRFNLKPIHFPVELEHLQDFPSARYRERFRERSPSDPLISFSSYLTEDRSCSSSVDRRVRFRSSSVESQDDVLSNVDHVQHTCSKSQSNNNFQNAALPQDVDQDNNFVHGAKNFSRRQFRNSDQKVSRGRTLPRVCTLPSGGFSYLQRPSSEDVVNIDIYSLGRLFESIMFCAFIRLFAGGKAGDQWANPLKFFFTFKDKFKNT